MLTNGRAALQGGCRIMLIACGIVAGFPSLASQTNNALLAQSQAASDSQVDALYQKGMQLLHEKRYLDALRQFEVVEEKAPRSPQGSSGQGIALALIGRPQEAISAFKRALAADPTFWVARRELGIVYWSRGLKDQAAGELRPIIELHPDDGVVNTILGQYEFEHKKYSEALVYWSHVPGQVAADPRLTLAKAEALLKTGGVPAARETLGSLIGRTGLTDEQLFELAWLMGQAKLFKQAIGVFRQLPEGSPDDFRRNYGLALAYFGDEQYANCITTLKALLARGSARPEAFSLLGVAEETSGHTQQAYDAFRQGILSSPGDQRNYLNIATLACEHLNYDLAVQILTSGIERVPSGHELFLSLGITYTLKSQFSLARQDYERAVQLSPEDSANYLAFGLSELETGNLDHAIKLFQEASNRAPQSARPYYFLAECLIQKGASPGTAEFQQAMHAVEKAITLDPEFAYAYLDRAKLELETREPHAIDEAIADLERARSGDPKSSSIAYLLGQTYQRKGEKTKAEGLFARVKESGRQDASQFRKDSLTQALVVISRGDQ